MNRFRSIVLSAEAAISNFLNQFQLPVIAKRSLRILMYSSSFLLVRKVTWDIWYWYRSAPPGPRGSSIPFIGDFISFSMSPVSWLLNTPHKYTLQKKYGLCNEIMSIPMGISCKIYINDITLAQNIAKAKLIDNRPNTFYSYGITPFSLIENINNPKNMYQQRRKLFSSVFLTITQKEYLLKSTNFALNNVLFPEMNDSIQDNKLWFPLNSVRYVLYNNAFGAIFGRYISIKEPFYALVNTLGRKSVENFGLLQMVDGLFGIGDIIGYLIYTFEGSLKRLTKEYKKWLENCGLYEIDYSKNILKYKNKSDFEISDVTEQTFMDNVISILSGKEKHKYYNIPLDVMIEDIILTLYVAQDTTGSAAQYGFYILASNMKLQNIIYNELKNIFQNDNKFSFKHLHHLHLFRAFIHEIIRASIPTPQGLARKAMKTFDVILSNNKKYIIRKNDVLFLNSAYMDLVQWKKMYDNKELYNKYIFGDNIYNTIYLNAWLDKNGHFSHNNSNSTFAWGQRSCPGKVLAIKELMCLFGELMLKYQFKPPNNEPSNINVKDRIFGGVTCLKNPVGIMVQDRKHIV